MKKVYQYIIFLLDTKIGVILDHNNKPKLFLKVVSYQSLKNIKHTKRMKKVGMNELFSFIYRLEQEPF